MPQFLDVSIHLDRRLSARLLYAFLKHAIFLRRRKNTIKDKSLSDLGNIKQRR